MSQHSLETGHTWKELQAFLVGFPSPVETIVEVSANDVFKIRYTIGENHATIAKAFCSPRSGWHYALPPGIGSGVKAAKAAGKIVHDALFSR
jgi:hypothetical protein